MSKRVIYLCLAFIVSALTYVGWKVTARGAYETAEYTVVKSEGPFEVRDYPPLKMATTNMHFEAQGNDGSFMRLFRYISGSNEADQKVAMTTPVFMQPAVEEAAGQMGFVIPKKIAAGKIPAPSGESVSIRERPGGRFAVIRFAGRMSSESLESAEGRLREWMKINALSGEKKIECAGYDPPWTPGPLRRNEVLIRLN